MDTQVKPPVVTAEMKVTKPDGTVIIEEVILDEESQRRLIDMSNKEREYARIRNGN